MKHRRLLVAGLLIVYGCGSTPAVSPSSASAAGVSPNASVGASPNASVGSSPSSYASAIYGYSVTLPAGWQTRPAKARWDGSGAPGHDDPTVDIVEPTTGVMSVFAFAAPITLDLTGYARDVVARNVQFHGDTCPSPTPDKIEPANVAGEPATFIAWNCGILINIVVVIHAGIGYEFVMRDPDVHAATDPTDRKAFDDLLASVKFPS
jgi:hypothetical protein